MRGRFHLSDGVVCSNCRADVAGEEVCPSCFSPVQVFSPLFTADCTPEQSFCSPTRLQIAQGFPDIQTVSFRPTSWFSRTFTRMKGGLASSLVAIFCVLVAVYFFHGYHLSRAQNAVTEAEAAWENEKYALALQQLDTAIKSYKTIYNTDGQIQGLSGKSDCFVKLGKYSEALSALESAFELENSQEMTDKIEKCHRIIAVDALEAAEHLFYEEEMYPEALAQAQVSLAEFKVGKASDSQLAGAERMVALTASAEHEFELADEHLDRAVALDETNPENDEVSSEIREYYNAYQKEKLAESKRNRYIPDGELEIQTATASETPTYRPKARRQYSTAKSRSNYNRRRSIPRQVKTTTGSKASYPTGKRPYRYSSSNRYRYNNYRRTTSTYNRNRSSIYNRNRSSIYNRNRSSIYNRNRTATKTNVSKYPKSTKYPSYKRNSYKPSSSRYTRSNYKSQSSKYRSTTSKYRSPSYKSPSSKYRRPVRSSAVKYRSPKVTIPGR